MTVVLTSPNTLRDLRRRSFTLGALVLTLVVLRGFRSPEAAREYLLQLH